MTNQLKIWVDKILNEQTSFTSLQSPMDPGLQEAADRRAEQEDVLEGPVNTNPTPNPIRGADQQAEQEDVLEGPVNTNPTRNPNPQNPSVDPATDDL
jgi:hypothetical protein